MEIKTYKKGEVIIEEGSCETCAYMIDTGKVEVSAKVNNKKTVIVTLGKNQIFGEMGLIEDTARSATITAIEDSTVRVIDRKSFNDLYTDQPKIVLPIIRSLFDRLRTATKLIKQTVDSTMSPVEPIPVVVEEEYIILSGANDVTKAVLGDTELKIKEFPFKVGRYSSGEVPLQNDVLVNNHLYITEDKQPYYVAKNHFELVKVDKYFVVVDRGSRPGIIVNGRIVKELCILRQEVNSIVVGTRFSPYVFSAKISKGDK